MAARQGGRRWPETGWYDPRVEIRPSGIQGGGMFALAPIRAGETIAIVGGAPMTDAEFAAYRATVERYNAAQIGENLHLVDLIQTPDRVEGSLNHSCDSNLWMNDEVTIAARRDIAAGEELTLDYALMTGDPAWRLDRPCHCGASACRHTVTGADWRLPDVQRRYVGHFAPFLNEHIARIGHQEK
ncbi:MAG TPA: SET domain-containing protein-lysine N-methyltransferase [Ktedonobacterales bacterium]|nr:SET domain-containing protein-lysine N-methyltransferase [Ktedonobacterales bacterium]